MKSIELPYDRNVERLILGAMLYSTDAANYLIDILDDSDFFISEHQYIFQAAKALYLKDFAIERTTIAIEMQLQGTFDKIGGIQKLIELSTESYYSAPFDDYAKTLKNFSRLRKLIYLSRSMMEKASLPANDSDDLIGELQDDLVKIQGEGDSKVKELNEVIKHYDEEMSLLDFVNDVHERKALGLNVYKGVCTGYPIFDQTLGGFKKGAIYYIGARTSMGKTTFLCNLINNIHITNPDMQIGFFSLEMGHQLIALKLMCLIADVKYDDCEDGELKNEQRARLTHTITSSLEGKNYLHIDDPDAITINNLCSRAKRMVQANKIEILFIDYLTRIVPRRIMNNKHNEVDSISKALQSLAKELDIPIVVLAQLNRQSTMRKDPTPTLTDFRESGSIEEDADCAILLHRPSYYEPMNKPGISQVIIAKNRIRGKLRKIEFSCDYTQSDRYFECKKIQDVMPSEYCRPKFIEEEAGPLYIPNPFKITPNGNQ